MQYSADLRRQSNLCQVRLLTFRWALEAPCWSALYVTELSSSIQSDRGQPSWTSMTDWACCMSNGHHLVSSSCWTLFEWFGAHPCIAGRRISHTRCWWAWKWVLPASWRYSASHFDFLSLQRTFAYSDFASKLPELHWFSQAWGVFAGSQTIGRWSLWALSVAHQKKHLTWWRTHSYHTHCLRNRIHTTASGICLVDSRKCCELDHQLELPASLCWRGRSIFRSSRSWAWVLLFGWLWGLVVHHRSWSIH